MMSRNVGAGMSGRAIGFVGALLLLLCGALPAWAQERIERWYAMEMMGQRAGWMHEITETKDGIITSNTESRMQLARGALKMTIEMDSTFVETAEGKPISMRSRQMLGAGEVVQEFAFTDTGVTQITTQGGKRSEKTAPRPEGEWLTPDAARRFFTQRFKSGAAEISVRTIDPQNGLTPANTKYAKFEPTTITIGDRKIDGKKCEVEISITPGVKSVEVLDSEGTVVRTETMMGGLSLVMTLSTAEAAAGEIRAPEIMINTFVKPDKIIEDARGTYSAVFLISDPENLPDIPTTGAQTFDRIDAKSGRLTVKRAVWAAAPEADAKNADFTAPTTMLDTNDARVKELAALAIAKCADQPAPQRAEAIRNFVHGYIRSKNLGVGFASATEVARNKSGDCSEHGVLTAALLRADGIPSRVVAGLIYADSFAGSENIFGYHMWTQALVEIDGAQRWIDLDATLAKPTPFDATHIALGVTALAEGDLSTSLTSMATTLGRLTIKVESISHEKPKDAR